VIARGDVFRCAVPSFDSGGERSAGERNSRTGTRPTPCGSGRPLRRSRGTGRRWASLWGKGRLPQKLNRRPTRKPFPLRKYPHRHWAEAAYGSFDNSGSRRAGGRIIHHGCSTGRIDQVRVEGHYPHWGLRTPARLGSPPRGNRPTAANRPPDPRACSRQTDPEPMSTCYDRCSVRFHDSLDQFHRCGDGA